MPEIGTVTLERADLETPIVLEQRDTSNDENTGGTMSDHQMTSPISAYLSVERSTDIIEGLFGLTASKILEVRPDEQAKEDAGITEPFATLTLDCTDGSYVLKIGKAVTETNEEDNTKSTYYPVMLNDEGMLYAVAADKCPWATITPTGLASKLVFTTYVWDISELEVTADGKQVSFANSGTDKDSASVTKDGKPVDTERYRLFYAFLLQTAAEEVVLGDAPTGTPDSLSHSRWERRPHSSVLSGG